MSDHLRAFVPDQPEAWFPDLEFAFPDLPYLDFSSTQPLPPHHQLVVEPIAASPSIDRSLSSEHDEFLPSESSSSSIESTTPASQALSPASITPTEAKISLVQVSPRLIDTILYSPLGESSSEIVSLDLQLKNVWFSTDLPLEPKYARIYGQDKSLQEVIKLSSCTLDDASGRLYYRSEKDVVTLVNLPRPSHGGSGHCFLELLDCNRQPLTTKQRFKVRSMHTPKNFGRKKRLP